MLRDRYKHVDTVNLLGSKEGEKTLSNAYQVSVFHEIRLF